VLVGDESAKSDGHTFESHNVTTSGRQVFLVTKSFYKTGIFMRINGGAEWTIIELFALSHPLESAQLD